VATSSTAGRPGRSVTTATTSSSRSSSSAKCCESREVESAGFGTLASSWIQEEAAAAEAPQKAPRTRRLRKDSGSAVRLPRAAGGCVPGRIRKITVDIDFEEPQARIGSCGASTCARVAGPSPEPSTRERSLLSQALSASRAGLFRDAELDFFTRRNRPGRGVLDPEPPVGKDRPGERAPPRRTSRTGPSLGDRALDQLPRLRSGRHRSSADVPVFKREVVPPVPKAATRVVHATPHRVVQRTHAFPRPADAAVSVQALGVCRPVRRRMFCCVPASELAPVCGAAFAGDLTNPR
jgi:hypothetical protein